MTTEIRNSDTNVAIPHPAKMKGEPKLSTSGIPPLKQLKVATTTDPYVGPCKVQLAADNSNSSLIQFHIFQNNLKSDVKMSNCAKMFQCNACSEIFYLKTGLDSHLNRETVTILLNCQYCGFDMTFLNRCVLLKHFQSHKVIPTVASLENFISFEPLKSDDGDTTKCYDYRIYRTSWPEKRTSSSHIPTRLIFQHPIQSIVNASDNPISSTPVRPKCGNEAKLERCFIRQPEQPFDQVNLQSELVLNSSTDEQHVSTHWCSICDKNFKSAGNFFAHLKTAELGGEEGRRTITGGDRYPFSCDLDGVPNFSLCGYQYHRKIFHDKISQPPFLCPECGKHFSDWNRLSSHARNRCFHFRKSLNYRCAATNGCTFATADTKELGQHFEEEHFRFVLQCNKCSNAFATDEWFWKHLWRDHGDGNPNKIQSNMLLDGLTKKLVQCLICRVVFYTMAHFRAHSKSNLNGHCNPEIVFVCEYCPMMFKSSQDIYLHYKSNHTHTLSADPIRHIPQSGKLYEGKESDKINEVGGAKNMILKESSRNEPKLLPMITSSKLQRKNHIVPTPPKDTPSQTEPGESAQNSKYTDAENGRKRRKRQVLRKCKYCPRRSTIGAIGIHEKECLKNKCYCSVCKVVFATQENLLDDGKKHLTEGLKICLICKNLELPVLKDWDEHFKVKHISGVENYPSPCLVNSCKHLLSDKEEGLIHLKRHHDLRPQSHSEVKHRCKQSQIQFESPDLINSHQFDKRKISGRSSPLPVMKSEPLDCPAASLSPGPRKNSERPHMKSSIQKPYFCRFCTVGKEFQSRSGIRKHIQLHHKDVKLTSLDWRTLRHHSVQLPLKKQKQREVMKRAHPVKIPKSKSERNSAPELQGPTELDDYFVMKMNPQLSRQYLYTPKTTESLKKASQARLTDGTFRCLKCFDQSPPIKSELEFIEHIKKHVLEHYDPYNSKEFVHDGFWCPECGMMFTSKPTLTTHFRCAHEFIENPARYVNKIGYGKQPLLKYQCAVCRFPCADEIDHASHIRTHGMAFLFRSRLQKVSDLSTDSE